MNRTAAALATTVALSALAALAALTTPSSVVRAAKPEGSAHILHTPVLAPRIDILALAPPPSFQEDLPPADASPSPTVDEWKTAPAIRLDHDVDACRAYRVREWVKIHCADLPIAGASLLTGTRTGAAIWVDAAKDDDTMKTPRSAEVIFPVRRGDGRLFQIGQFGEGYDGPVAWNVVFTVSEQWIEGPAAPVITVR